MLDIGHSFPALVTSQPTRLTADDDMAVRDERAAERQSQFAGLALVVDVNALEDLAACGIEDAQVSVGCRGVNMRAGESGAGQCGRAVADALPPELFPLSRKVQGDDFPVEGRIIGLADSFDAMTSDRTYRKALPLDVVVKEIREWSGRQFDEEIVEKLLSLDLTEFITGMHEPEKTVFPLGAGGS